VRWVIILDWPGLEYQVYPVKITRSVTVASLEEQVDGCVIRCPASMDSVLNCLKLKQLSSSFDYKFFSDDIVRKYLLLEKYVKFEDYCVEQYCERMAGLYLSAEMTGTLINCRRISNVIVKVMQQLRKTRNTRIEKEAYLQSNFQCDMRRSLGELLKIVRDKSNKDSSVCSRY